MHRVIDRLQNHYDTVLQIGIARNNFYIVPSPSVSNLETSSIVAFKRERFSQGSLQAALEAAVSKKYKGSYRFRRRVYHQLMKLKGTIKSGFRR